MGKREIRRWNIFTLRGGVFLILTGAFLLGGVLGCLFAALADEQGAQELEQYLRQYITLLGNGALEVSFWSVLWSQGRYVLAAGLLGSAVLGVVGLPVLMGLRGFLLSFSVAVCYRVFGTAGLWSAGVLFGIPALFWLPCLLFCGAWGMKRGLKLLRSGGGNAGVEIVSSGRELRVLLCTAVFLAAGIFVEYIMVPLGVELVLRLI